MQVFFCRKYGPKKPVGNFFEKGKFRDLIREPPFSYRGLFMSTLRKRFFRNAIFRDYVNEGKNHFWFVSFPLQRLRAQSEASKVARQVLADSDAPFTL